MRRQARASSAGSSSGRGSRLGRFFHGAFAIRGASSDATGSSAPSSSALAALALSAAAALFLFMALAASSASAAQTYTTGTALTTGKLTTSVAVNQSSRDLYAASAGGIAGGFAEAGLFQRFNSAGEKFDGTPGHEPACALGGSPEHPSSVAVNPENGHLYVITMANTGFSNETELLTYGQTCGAKLAIVEATGNLTEGLNEVTGLSAPSSGAFAVGQFLTGTKIPAFTKITGCLPSCSSATSLTLSAAVEAGGTAAAAPISATAFNLPAASTFPIPQPATDSQGNIYYGNPTVNTTSTVKKFKPNGEEITLEHPITGSLTRPASVALDAAGDIYVAAGAKSCSSVLTSGRLRVYKPNGEFIKNFPSEGSPATEVTTVAVNRATNEIFVGHGCHSGFKIEKYSLGGAKLTEFGSGVFTGLIGTNPTAYDQLAIDETNGKVYAADPDAGKVQVFSDTSTKMTLGTTTTGTGEVKCNSGTTCLSEYDEGSEIPVEAVGGTFEEWNGGTGSATSCTGSVSPTCTFTLSANSTVNAKFEVTATEFPLTVTKTGAGTGTVTSSPAGISCGGTCSAEFEESTVVTLTPSAGSESEFREWTGACSGAGACEVTMSEAKSVNAFFAHEKRLLTVSKAGGGDGTVKAKPYAVNCGTNCGKGEARLYKGTLVTLTAKQGKESLFAGFSGGGCSTSPCTVTMETAKTVTATFTGTAKVIPNEQTLTLSKGPGTGYGTVKSKPGGIGCEANCVFTEADFAGEVGGSHPKLATTVVLTATPAAGSSFSGWSGGACAGLELTCSVTMETAKAVTASFTAKPKQVLTVSKAGSGDGTVKAKPYAVNCPTNCQFGSEAELPEGTLVTLTAKQGKESTFTGWTGCTSEPEGPLGKCLVTMSGAEAVTATFTGTAKLIPNEQLLTLAKAGTGYGTVKSKPGGIGCEANCVFTEADFAGEVGGSHPKLATTVVLTATAAAGSELTGWSGCESQTVTPAEGTCTVLMSATQEVSATFDE